MTKLTDKEREEIIKDVLGYTPDELQQIYRECDESECSWCRWKHLYLCHSRNYAAIPSISAGLIPNIWHSWRAMRSVGSQRL